MDNWNTKSDEQLIKIIGESLKGRRIKKNISQEELSRLSGISAASITRIETGKGNISLSNLLSVFKALEMANELKAIFKKLETSPALLARATAQKTQMRVRRLKKSQGKDENWQWGEDKQ
ncbi:MAG: helix-turn-helix transcriptional regulator [Bacteriovoracaceae bacterium]|nr:helix-turn-helix transcriptional regulator [Bacteriovoracaceae bacterium]